MLFAGNRIALFAKQIVLDGVIPPRIRFEQVLVSVAVLVGVGLGVIAVFIGPRIPYWTPHKLALFSLAGPALLGIVLARKTQQALMVATVLAIPINFSFAPLGKVPTYSGGAQAGLILYMYDFPLIALVGYSILRALINKVKGTIAALEVVGGLLILWSVVSMLQADHVGHSAFEIARMLKLLVLAHVTASIIRSTDDLQTVIGALMVGLALQCIVAAVQSQFGTDLGFGLNVVGDLHRATGTLGWPNTLGAYAAALNTISFTIWILMKGGRFSLLCRLAWVFGMIPLALSLSRGAWVAQSASFLAVLALAWHMRRLRAATFLRSVLLLLLALMVALVFWDSIANRLTEQTFAERISLNQVALSMVAQHPITGIGINNFVKALPDYDLYGLSFTFPEPVHNVYLLFAAEVGVPGLALFVGVLLLMSTALVSTAASKDPTLSVTAIALLGGITALCISNLMDVHLRSEVLYALFWLIGGLAIASQRMKAQSTPHAGRLNLRASTGEGA